MSCSLRQERGRISGRLFTIIQTARVNGLVGEDYLSYAMENISNSPIENLIPRSENLPRELKIKNVLIFMQMKENQHSMSSKPIIWVSFGHTLEQLKLKLSINRIYNG